jgi:hypothetical protein
VIYCNVQRTRSFEHSLVLLLLLLLLLLVHAKSLTT